MALFWHNHFATAYSKIAGTYGGTEATRMMAAKPGEDRGGVRRVSSSCSASTRSATSATC